MGSMAYQEAIAAAVCMAASVAWAEQASPEQEQKLDKLALAYEDLAHALDGVEDITDADLVAARVAADFLLMRELHAALQRGKTTETSPEFAKSFATRCAEAGKTAKAAMERLREHSCYESDALMAALSLAPLMDAASLQKSPALAAAVMELVANNREMIILILDEAVDNTTASQVAALVQAAFIYGETLSAFADEVGDGLLEEEKKQDFGQRFENFNIDFSEHRARLTEKGYFGCDALRSVFEREAGKQGKEED